MARAIRKLYPKNSLVSSVAVHIVYSMYTFFTLLII